MTEVENRFERRKQVSRDRILAAALELFRTQGLDNTTIDAICERADVATRTFFNHFATRDDMVRALALTRLRGIETSLAEREMSGQPALDLLVAFFDDVARALAGSGPHYRHLVGEMLALSYGAPRGGTDRSSELYTSFLGLVKHGVARGEVTTAHDPLTLTDIVVGTLNAVLMNWTSDETYNIESGLHDAARALADLLAPTRRTGPARRKRS